MGRRARFADITVSAALESPCRERHAAAITYGKDCVAVGTNNARTRFMRKSDISCHAEVDAATRYVNTVLRRMEKKKRVRKLRNSTVWSVRICQDTCGYVALRMSAPCAICVHRLKALGFGRVAFTNPQGDVETHRLASYQNTHMSTTQRRFSRDITW